MFDDLKPISARQLSRETGLSCHTIRSAMDAYAASRGKRGLPFISPGGVHRYVRPDQVRMWYERLEREAAGL